eukprot:4459404-Amphidinium_carterae.1
MASPGHQTVNKARPTASPTLAAGKKAFRGTRAGSFRQARAASHKRRQATVPQGPTSPLPSQPSTGDLPSPPWRFVPSHPVTEMREGGATPTHGTPATQRLNRPALHRWDPIHALCEDLTPTTLASRT